MLKVLVNIPAYNESERIASVIKKIPRTMDGVEKVFVSVVDDGSYDNTSLIAKDAGADFIYVHASNSGVAHAFNTAIHQAILGDYDIFVNIDADGQFNPSEIPNLIAPLLEGRAEIVLGSRFVSNSYKKVPIIKRAGNLIIGGIVSILSAQRIHDTQCGFRALSRKALNSSKVSGLFTYTQEMILRLAYKRMRIVEIPISVRYFQNRKSRVVKSIPKYTFKAIAVIVATLLSLFHKSILMVFGLASLVTVLAALFST